MIGGLVGAGVLDFFDDLPVTIEVAEMRRRKQKNLDSMVRLVSD